MNGFPTGVGEAEEGLENENQNGKERVKLRQKLKVEVAKNIVYSLTIYVAPSSVSFDNFYFVP